MIDEYSLKARAYPLAIVLSPSLVPLGKYLLVVQEYGSFFASLGIAAMLVYLMSQLGRDAGKKKEKALWDSWGGPPSTQLLRFSNTTLDAFTKVRYHKILIRLCQTNHIITPET